jgi:hypothetical protein
LVVVLLHLFVILFTTRKTGFSVGQKPTLKGQKPTLKAV